MLCKKNLTKMKRLTIHLHNVEKINNKIYYTITMRVKTGSEGEVKPLMRGLDVSKYYISNIA